MLLRFSLEWDIYYVWTVRCFRLSCSPFFFKKVLRPVITCLREQQLQCALYVDDWLLICTRAQCADHNDVLVHTLLDLGIHINWGKGNLVPTTCKEFVGFIGSSEGVNGVPWICSTQKGMLIIIDENDQNCNVTQSVPDIWHGSLACLYHVPKQ